MLHEYPFFFIGRTSLTQTSHVGKPAPQLPIPYHIHSVCRQTTKRIIRERINHRTKVNTNTQEFKKIKNIKIVYGCNLKFTIRFYLVAILFLIFDLEVSFLFP